MEQFYKDINFSQGIEVGKDGILNHLLTSIPGSIEIVRANGVEDRHGTDWWIIRDNGLPFISVDMKHRRECPIEKYGRDDACIETCSVFVNGERRKLGWSINPAKRTDLICYTWPTATSKRRFWVVYFPFLCAAATAHWHEWAAKYKERQTRPELNDGYVTLSVYPFAQRDHRGHAPICGRLYLKLFPEIR